MFVLNLVIDQYIFLLSNLSVTILKLQRVTLITLLITMETKI